jgi:hypothetical protein
MSNKLTEILMDIKKVRPDLTDEQAQHLLESMENFCEIIIGIYMENAVAENKRWRVKLQQEVQSGFLRYK